MKTHEEVIHEFDLEELQDILSVYIREHYPTATMLKHDYISCSSTGIRYVSQADTHGE